MKIMRQSDSELVVKDNGLWLSAVLIIASLPLFYATLAHRARGTLFGAGFFLVCALICLRRSSFTFDAGRRTVSWRTTRWLRTSTGSVAFDAITDIGLEPSSGSAEGTTYRLTIITPQQSIPLTDFYSAGRQRHESLREQLLSFVKGSAEGTPRAQPSLSDVVSVEPSIRALLQQGRKIDAVHLLRSTGNVSLTEAMQRIEEIEKQVPAQS